MIAATFVRRSGGIAHAFAVPLCPPDPDVPLDLQAALDTVYEQAAYDLSIDYTKEPPPPPLSPEDAAWMKERLADHVTSAR